MITNIAFLCAALDARKNLEIMTGVPHVGCERSARKDVPLVKPAADILPSLKSQCRNTHGQTEGPAKMLLIMEICLIIFKV
jgi:hypothetical protein